MRIDTSKRTEHPPTLQAMPVAETGCLNTWPRCRMKSRQTYRPSAAAIEMLENIANGLSPTAGLSGRSAHGGAAATYSALYRHGLRDEKGVTAEGLAAISKARQKSRGES